MKFYNLKIQNQLFKDLYQNCFEVFVRIPNLLLNKTCAKEK